MLRDYVAGLAKIINDLTKTNLIVTSDLKTDYRTDKIGIVEGMLTFMDNSELFFTEYIDGGTRCKNSATPITTSKRAGGWSSGTTTHDTNPRCLLPIISTSKAR